ncbi:MAG: urease accessory protein UreD [Haliea sp.]|nr:urease accessory protein UreD [Haliea sp.]
MNTAVAAKQGWQALLQLHYGLRADRTRLISKQQRGPLTLQRAFYPEGRTCHSYILHPPGGVVGGDSLAIDIHTEAGAHCLLTNPGATKFYRAAAQRRASATQHIAVATGAIVEWLPQQNIFFPGANVEVATTIDIAHGGKYIGWEINCLGRPANGETFNCGSLRATTHVRVDGELRLAERLHVSDEQALGAATGMRGLPLQGCMIAAPCNGEQRALLEQILQTQIETPEGEYPYPIGLTLVDEILVVRALGEQSETLQALFTRLWVALREQWLDKPACIPRIWST